LATSPTQRSLKYLRDQGMTCQVVEHWNQWARIRQDLWGFVDIVALKVDLDARPGYQGSTIGVQTTSLSNVSARVEKIKASELYPIVKYAGWMIVVHGWGKGKDGKWKLREVWL